MTYVVRILREPLVHFLLIGLVVFAVYASLNEGAPDRTTDNQIEITMGDVGQMIAQFQTTWRRPPTAQELDTIIEARIRESILINEALALSMDKNDAIINQRLNQKMTFLLESAARANAPSENELMAYFEENKGQYSSAPLIAFEHVFFGDAPDEAEVERALADLLGGADPASLGTRTMLPPRVPLSPQTAVDGTFGRGVFATLSEIETGTWTVPVRSGFGVHAVRILEAVPAAPPAFEALKERVIADYTAAAAADATEAIYAELRARYVVSVPDASELAGALQ